MDADEPEQLYRTLLIEQEMNPSQIVSILVEYYKMLNLTNIISNNPINRR